MLRSLSAILVVLLLGAAAGGAYWYFVMVPASQQAASAQGGRLGGGPVPVEAQPVRIAPAETTIGAVGTMLSNESVVLRPEVAGRVSAINFTEGGKVTKGQVLVELESTIERADLAKAEAQRDLARSNFERAKELRRNNVGTQRSLDEAEAAIRVADAEVQLAKARLEKRQLVAPFDARTGLRLVSIGEFVNAGTSIVNLEQIDPLKVDFRVPEIFLAAVETGQSIEVAIDAFPGERFRGTVTTVNPLIDENGRSIVIRARIDNPAERLRPGLFARVNLTLATRQEARWVPEQSIVPQGEQQFVYKVVDPGDGKPKTVKLAEVKLGIRRRGEVEIVEGVAETDMIVTAGVLRLRDGAPVQVQPGGGSPPPNGRSTARSVPAGGAAPAQAG